MSGINSIDKTIKYLENVAKVKCETPQEAVFVNDIIETIKLTCADLLGKPLVDARDERKTNEPFCGRYCIARDRDCECRLLDDTICPLFSKAKGCPVDWTES